MSHHHLETPGEVAADVISLAVELTLFALVWLFRRVTRDESDRQRRVSQ